MRGAYRGDFPRKRQRQPIDGLLWFAIFWGLFSCVPAKLPLYPPVMCMQMTPCAPEPHGPR